MTSRLMASWDMGAAQPPDATTGNLPAGMGQVKSTSASNPVPYFLQALFDSAQDEHLHFGPIRIPEWFVTFDKAEIAWKANATTGTALFGVRVSAITEDDADTPNEHSYSTENTGSEAVNATEARRLKITPVTLTNADSAAVGDLVQFILTRKGSDSGTDTLSVDAEVENFSIYANDA